MNWISKILMVNLILKFINILEMMRTRLILMLLLFLGVLMIFIFEHTLIGKLKLEPSLKLQSINKKYFGTTSVVNFLNTVLPGEK